MADALLLETGDFLLLEDGFKLLLEDELIGTTTVVVSSQNPCDFGTLISLDATVTPDSGIIVPTGTVDFYDGVTFMDDGILDDGVAEIGSSELTVGSHNITAVYSGDGTFSGSTSSILVQVINGEAPLTPILLSQSCM